MSQARSIASNGEYDGPANDTVFLTNYNSLLEIPNDVFSLLGGSRLQTFQLLWSDAAIDFSKKYCGKSFLLEVKTE